MAEVYNSGPISGLSFASPKTVNHNLGYVPAVYSVQSISGGVAGGWEPMDPDDPMGEAGVYVDSFTATSAVVKMRDGYSYSGDFVLVCYNQPRIFMMF